MAQHRMHFRSGVRTKVAALFVVVAAVTGALVLLGSSASAQTSAIGGTRVGSTPTAVESLADGTGQFARVSASGGLSTEGFPTGWLLAMLGLLGLAGVLLIAFAIGPRRRRD